MDDFIDLLLAHPLLAAVMIGLIPATIAYRRGRNFWAWWIFGAALFILALPVALFIKPDRQALDERAIRTGDVRKCPACAELVRTESNTCRFCGATRTSEPTALG